MSAIQPLKQLIVDATAKHTATVIFVHGLGDTGAGWEPVANMFKRDQSLSHVKWVLPHAPIKPITANMGMEMPAWFDILDFDLSKTSDDEPGMLETVRALNGLISSEVDDGIPASRIVLGGFSQGGSMSLLTGLSNERKLGGIVCLSGWVPLRHKFKAMVSDHAKSLPIFWGHGTHDPLVRYELAIASSQFLKKEVGIKVAEGEETVGLSFHPYEGEVHSTCPKELSDLQAWLKRVIPSSTQ
ncbi:hypothetical protein M0805_005764 [Coniferiporia weirii]|nr:hypothetical protein M0805_005764 [Coniferiporia weirii]